VKQQQAKANPPAGVTQGAAAPQPNAQATSPAARGYALFKTKGCVGCHSIAGYPEAKGQIGPNLTHVASRSSIVAGWLPNTPANLQRWLRDPNAVKPDNIMGTAIKAGTLKEDEIAALSAYLRSLK
jgi:cytochrome c oxidase subunit 2